MDKQRIIACDFDGTLAEYNEGDYDKLGHRHLGKPIPEMVKKVKDAIAAGDAVVIFTARVNTMSATPQDLLAATECYLLIAQWCKTYIGKLLPITYEKSGLMTEFTYRKNKISFHRFSRLSRESSWSHRLRRRAIIKVHCLDTSTPELLRKRRQKPSISK